MVSLNNPPQILENLVSVRGASEWSGYSVGYIRRLLRNGDLIGSKIGQVWLVSFASLVGYLSKHTGVDDCRYGPRS